MKFGKRLKRQIEDTLPEWRDKFLSYKDLKKLLRLIFSPSSESRFIRLLHSELHKINSFFVEQEEDFIIRQKELQERILRATQSHQPSTAEMSRIRKDMVNFHGEMVLLVNYSSINYTGDSLRFTRVLLLYFLSEITDFESVAGLAKILKKYDKRTGAVLRLPFIEKVLKQPFFTTELVSRLVRNCESMMDAIFPATEEAAGGGREAAEVAEQSIFRNTLAALVTIEELRKGSSTYGCFSLPPMGSPLAGR